MGQAHLGYQSFFVLAPILGPLLTEDLPTRPCMRNRSICLQAEQSQLLHDPASCNSRQSNPEMKAECTAGLESSSLTAFQCGGTHGSGTYFGV